MICVEQTCCSFRGGWKTPPPLMFFEELKSFSYLGPSPKALLLGTLGYFSGSQAIQMSSETGLTQTFFLSKLVEKYTVVKIKFCWCVNSLSLTLTKQLKLCGLPLKNNNQTLISACLLPKYFMTGESVRNQPDRINRTLWTVVRFLMLMLILSWSCNLMVSQPVYFNIIFYVPFCLCSQYVLIVHWMDMSGWADAGVSMRDTLIYVTYVG